MRPTTEYFLCCIATPFLSEFPLHTLELVDEKDNATAHAIEIQPNQEKPEHEKSAASSLDYHPEPQLSQNDDDSSDIDRTAQRNKEYGIMLAVVSILLLYCLWTISFFTWNMQRSKQESITFQCFYWSATLATAARLIYGLIGCTRFYVYVFRPWWLPEGIPLRLQAFQDCSITLTLAAKTFFIVVAGLVVKVLVWDNLMKLALFVFGV
ncbi:hypothetical protein H2200_005132 [Cladophialophora chaetospira]|uniref:Uncharacterized protein n=1 Tax=Cladophialophora chaetospira TaxID=386627 RepID=A0AA38XBE9_9EURO|nr:hypothetical protein H2200_005132 [Cladophialophora chaetospira]